MLLVDPFGLPLGRLTGGGWSSGAGADEEETGLGRLEEGAAEEGLTLRAREGPAKGVKDEDAWAFIDCERVTGDDATGGGGGGGGGGGVSPRCSRLSTLRC